jgi:glutathione S-transferase
MITLHGATISPYVRKVAITLNEKGIEYNLNPVNPFPAPKEHFEISPLGKIPAITDGDYSLAD